MAKIIEKDKVELKKGCSISVYYMDDGTKWFEKEEIRNILLCSIDVRFNQAGMDFNEITKNWETKGAGDITLIESNDIYALITLLTFDECALLYLDNVDYAKLKDLVNWRDSNENKGND